MASSRGTLGVVERLCHITAQFCAGMTKQLHLGCYYFTRDSAPGLLPVLQNDEKKDADVTLLLQQTVCSWESPGTSMCQRNYRPSI